MHGFIDTFEVVSDGVPSSYHFLDSGDSRANLIYYVLQVGLQK